MPSVANPPSDLASRCSFPPPDPDTIIHGVLLSELLDRCKSIAHRYYHRHGCRTPIEEYVSVAHVRLMECMARFDPDLAPRGGFLSYALWQVICACRHLPRRTAERGNMKAYRKGEATQQRYAIEQWDSFDRLPARCATQARQEEVVYVQEVLGELSHRGGSGEILLAMVAGVPQETLAAEQAVAASTIASRAMRLRRTLRAWASEVHDDTP